MFVMDGRWTYLVHISIYQDACYLLSHTSWTHDAVLVILSTLCPLSMSQVAAPTQRLVEVITPSPQVNGHSVHGDHGDNMTPTVEIKLRVEKFTG